MGRSYSLGCMVSGVLLAATASPSSRVIWRADASTAPIPARPASGQVRGRRFIVRSAGLNGSTLILRDGKGDPGDRALMIHFLLRPGEKPDGKVFAFRSATDPGAPRISFQWHVAGESLPEVLWVDRYSLRVELGRAQGNRLPGGIYLCIADPQKSFVAGRFTASD